MWMRESFGFILRKKKKASERDQVLTTRDSTHTVRTKRLAESSESACKPAGTNDVQDGAI